MDQFNTVQLSSDHFYFRSKFFILTTLYMEVDSCHGIRHLELASKRKSIPLFIFTQKQIEMKHSVKSVISLIFHCIFLVFTIEIQLPYDMIIISIFLYFIMKNTVLLLLLLLLSYDDHTHLYVLIIFIVFVLIANLEK